MVKEKIHADRSFPLTEMFSMDQTKTQGDGILSPAEAPPGAVISPDTLRENRIPPGQSRTRKWPILDASGAPPIDLATWTLRVSGLVARPVTIDWPAFNQLPRTRVFSDFHCVTRWSRLGNLWEGVAIGELIALAGGVHGDARFVIARGHDGEWSTNMPLDDVLAEDVLIATHHDGDPLTAEHGGPARLIVPRLYAWKSAKWIAALEFIDQDRAGFWERNGYHMHGDPWRQERYGW